VKVPFLPIPSVETLIDLSFSEDMAGGDVTSEIIFDKDKKAIGNLMAKSEIVICGLPLVPMIFKRIDPTISFHIINDEGQRVDSGTVFATLKGSALSLLIVERTILNFLQHLSAIATKTSNLLAASQGKAAIVDTRKTIPGWRYLQKYAVRVGGGRNHRMDLSSGVMIKDNHIDVAGSITSAIEKIRKQAPHLLKIEIEVRNMEEAAEAIQAKADVLLLDNMSPQLLKEITTRFKGMAIFEASGGIDENTVNEVSKTGVDFISMGALTHTIKAADISMKMKIIQETE
jgi:nicotinate-nucleotide pyrophosphorylase (carboxylating)